LLSAEGIRAFSGLTRRRVSIHLPQKREFSGLFVDLDSQALFGFIKFDIPGLVTID
jgi:hypothetical protein